MIITDRIFKNREPATVARLSTARHTILAALALVLLPLGLAANEGDKGIVKDVGGLKVELLVGSPGARIGTNEFMARVRDAEGKPVTDAMIMLSVDMDKGSAMTMDMGKEKPKGVAFVADSMEPGMYKGKVELGFKGRWIASMDLSRGSGAGAAKADFPFEVAEAGPNWGILLGFGAVFIVVIGAAVLLRSRKPKTAGGSAA